MRLRLGPILLCLLAGSPLHAQDSIYVGVGLSRFDYQENIPDVFITGISDTSSAYKLFGGFRFNDYVALEVSFGQTDDLTFNGTENAPGFGAVDYSLVTDFKISSLKAIGQLPMEWGALLGGLGTFRAENDFFEEFDTELGGSFARGSSFTDTGLTATLGVEWRFGRFGTSYGIRFEYEWWEMEGIDTSSLGLAFTYGF